jgi:hypothetical protein
MGGKSPGLSLLIEGKAEKQSAKWRVLSARKQPKTAFRLSNKVSQLVTWLD